MSINNYILNLLNIKDENIHDSVKMFRNFTKKKEL